MSWIDEIDQDRVITGYRVNGGEWVTAIVRDAETGAAVIFAEPDDDVEFRYSEDPPDCPPTAA